MSRTDIIYTEDPFNLEKICKYIDNQIKNHKEQISLLLEVLLASAKIEKKLRSGMEKKIRSEMEKNFGSAVQWAIMKEYFILLIISLQKTSCITCISKWSKWSKWWKSFI